MRLPVTSQLSTKDGVSNKNARLTNTLKEAKGTGDIATVRPGLLLSCETIGNGKGIVSFNNTLISIYEANLYRVTPAYDAFIYPGPQVSYMRNVSWCNDKYIATGDTYSSYYSYDGETWVDGGEQQGAYFLDKVAYSNGVYVTTGQKGSFNNWTTVAQVSSNGINWAVTQTFGTNTTISTDGNIIHNGQNFVTTITDGTTQAYSMVSANGVTWSQNTITGCSNAGELAFGNGVFVLLSGDSDGEVFVSADGVTWSQYALPTARIFGGMAFNGSMFVAVSADCDYCITSTDGQTWTERSTGLTTFGQCMELAWNDDVLMLCEYGNGFFAFSRDGITWTAIDGGAGRYWRSIASNGTEFVAVGFIDTGVIESALVTTGDTLDDLGPLTGDFFDFAQSTL